VLRQMYIETLGEDGDSTVTRYNGGWAKTVTGLDKCLNPLKRVNSILTLASDFTDVPF